MPTLNAKVTRNAWWLVSLALALIVALLAVDRVERSRSDARVRQVLTRLCDVRTLQSQAVMNYADREAAIDRTARFIDAPTRENMLRNAAQLSADLASSQKAVDCTDITNASGAAAEHDVR